MMAIFLSSKLMKRDKLIAPYVTDCHYKTTHLPAVHAASYSQAGCLADLLCTYCKILYEKAWPDVYKQRHCGKFDPYSTY